MIANRYQVWRIILFNYTLLFYDSNFSIYPFDYIFQAMFYHFLLCLHIFPEAISFFCVAMPISCISCQYDGFILSISGILSTFSSCPIRLCVRASLIMIVLAKLCFRAIFIPYVRWWSAQTAIVYLGLRSPLPYLDFPLSLHTTFAIVPTESTPLLCEEIETFSTDSLCTIFDISFSSCFLHHWKNWPNLFDWDIFPKL